MGSFKHYALAGVLALAASTTAYAADLLPPPPMPYAPAIEVGGGWYLRGDIGMTNQQVDHLSFGNTDADFEKVHLDFDSSPLAGVGVGYQFNHWIRADVTGEYRGKASFHGFERPSNMRNIGWGTDEYRATLSSWVGLANLYFDLGTWYGFTPFIGAGVGFSHNMIDNFIDVNTPNGSVAFGPSENNTDFAWAVHAGLAYDVTQNFKIELAYRYLNMGEGKTGVLQAADRSSCNVCAPFKFKELESHDFKVGLRWMLGGPVMAASNAPIIRKY